MATYQEEQFSKIANSIRVMQGGTTDNFSATDFANQIRNIDRDSLPYKSTIALEDNAVVVQDSLDDELDELVVYGASEQTVTEQGKNLFDITQAVTPLFVANGDGTYTFTADGGYGFTNRVEVDIPANTPYTLSIDCGEKSTTSPRLPIVIAKPDGTNDYSSIPISGNTRNSKVYTNDYGVVSFRFYTEGWTAGDFVEINNIQLELGTTTTTYEPFIPDSPSPDYPAEIRSVGGEVTEQGKNLFDITQAVNTLFVANGDGTYTYTADGGYGFANRVAVDIPANTPYTLSIDCGEKSTTSPYMNISKAKPDGTNDYSSIPISGNTRNSTVYIHDYDVVSLRFYLEGWTSGDYVEINNIQLELGSEATDYTLYVEPTTIEVPTLYGIGDVKDVMYVDRAQERAWIARKLSSYSHNGVVTNVYSASSLYWRAYSYVFSDATYAYTPILCDKAPTISTNPTTIITDFCLQKQTNFQFYFPWGFGGSEFGVSAVAELLEIANAYLSQYAPFTFVYQVEPYIEELDYTALHTHFGGTTIMFTPSDDSPSPVVAEVTLRTITDHTNEDIVSMALTSMGVEPSGDTETDLTALETLGVDPYSVTSYDTSETYANEVQALGVQPTNNATDNIEILNELGVSVYE